MPESESSPQKVAPKLFKDETFALKVRRLADELFTEDQWEDLYSDVGRPARDPKVMTIALILQQHRNLSDRLMRGTTGKTFGLRAESPFGLRAESPFGLLRNRCSTCSGIAVRLGPEYSTGTRRPLHRRGWPRDTTPIRSTERALRESHGRVAARQGR